MVAGTIENEKKMIKRSNLMDKKKRYTARYLQVHEKSFNKKSTMQKFLYKNAYKLINIRQGNKLIMLKEEL